MTFKFIALTIAAIAAGLPAGCSKVPVDGTGGGVYTIELETDALNIDWDSTGSVSTGVVTDDPDWTAVFADEADGSWLSLTPDRSSSVLRVRAKSVNDNEEMRSAAVTVATKAGNASVNLTVNQFGTGSVLRADPAEVELGRTGGEVVIRLTSNVGYEATFPDWLEQTAPVRSLEENEFRFRAGENTTGEIRRGKIEFHSTDISPQITAVVDVSQKSSLDFVVPKDIQFGVQTAEALGNEYNPGQGIELSYDGDLTTNYHSRYGSSTVFPVILEYTMATGADRVDYILYYAPAGNGAFGEVELWANTRSDKTMIKIADYDCGMSSGQHFLEIPGGIEWPFKFRFVVKTGGADVATCSEMMFFKYAGGNEELAEAVLKVFASQACMQLRDDYTQSDLNRLPDNLRDIAGRLADGTYPAEFRCESYAAYTDPAQMAKVVVTKAFSCLDNPVGIETSAGEPFQVYVGDMYGNSAKILNLTDGFVGGEYFQLREGVNEFTPAESGMLYVQYYVDDPAAASALPIEIHVADSGTTVVTGYFNLEKHRTVEELERLLKLPDPTTGYFIFPIQGERVQWNFVKNTLMDYGNTPEKLIQALIMWDDMMGNFWRATGIENLKCNNRQLALSIIDEDSYMSATSFYIVIESRSTAKKINPDHMFEYLDQMWGVGHEFGHQLDTAFTWEGQYESSNNFFSNMCIWYFAQDWNSGMATYGPGLQVMMDYAFDQKRNFMMYELQENAAGEYVFDDPGMFLKARMYWQLYVYYHIAGKNPDFYPDLFAFLRTQTKITGDPQAQSMKFYRDLCDHTQLDFTDFFQCWGYFNPVDHMITQYGTVRHLLTPEMVEEAQAYVKAKNYPKAPPIQYIDDRRTMERWPETIGQVGYYQTYIYNPAVSPDISYSREGDKITITNGENAVGFEIRDSSPGGTLVDISVVFEFETPYLTGSNRLYAVRADGTRTEIPET